MAAKKKDAPVGVTITVLKPLALVWDNQYFELYAGDTTEIPFGLYKFLADTDKINLVGSPAPVQTIEEPEAPADEVVAEEAE